MYFCIEIARYIDNWSDFTVDGMHWSCIGSNAKGNINPQYPSTAMYYVATVMCPYLVDVML